MKVCLCVCVQYMGSTPIILTGIASAKTARMQQAQQVVKLFRVHTYIQSSATVYTILCAIHTHEMNSEKLILSYWGALCVCV